MLSISEYKFVFIPIVTYTWDVAGRIIKQLVALMAANLRRIFGENCIIASYACSGGLPSQVKDILVVNLELFHAAACAGIIRFAQGDRRNSAANPVAFVAKAP